MKARKIINEIERRIISLEYFEKSKIEEIINENDSSFWLDEIMKLGSFAGIDEVCVEEILSQYE